MLVETCFHSMCALSLMMFNAVAAHVQLKGIRTESLSRNTYTQNEDQNALNTQKKKDSCFWVANVACLGLWCE